jgi:Lon protease-like protein
MDLPHFIPLFPLPNVVLFPEVPLPLHVFEPRYREMVRDALAGPRVIGMVLLRGNWEAEYHGAPEVYRVGCAGKIVDVTPLPDGKFNIVLAGMREFEIVSEQRERSYRQATVAWRPPPPETTLPPGLRERLVRTIEQSLGRTGNDVVRQLLGDSGLDDLTLVNFFAFWLDLAPLEKQCLLETGGEERARRLLEVLEFQRYTDPAALGEPTVRRMH